MGLTVCLKMVRPKILTHFFNSLFKGVEEGSAVKIY